MRRFLPFACLLLCCGMAMGSAQIFVDAQNASCPGSGTQQDPFCLIQLAINAAADFDEIVVAPGLYRENIDFRGKQVRVRSTDGPDVTIIEATNPGATVKFQNGETSTSILEGFTVRGGSPGIEARQMTSPAILGNTISGNNRRDGAGIYMIGSSAYIIGNVIENNTAELKGAGMFIVGGSPYIRSNTIRENSGGVSGGIETTSRCKPHIANNVIHDNWGRGIALTNSTIATIINNTITRNTSYVGAGIELLWSSQAYVTNTIVWDNIPDSTSRGVNSNIVVRASNIEGQNFGGQSINQNPHFIFPVGGDFRLSCDSPCIDSGVSNGVQLPFEDADGEARVQDGDGDGFAEVDIGADEFGPLWRFQGFPRVGGNLVNFIVQAPSTFAGQTAILAMSLSDSETGVVLPGGMRLPLQPDGLTQLWLSLPAAYRTATVTVACHSLPNQTKQFKIPPGFPIGVEIFWSGFTYDGTGTITDVLPAKSLLTE
ncbi:MAG: right-handed parallel beta-helix repeat-containing protein [Planctomycetota bacterium]